jgi:hypothetical protein
MANDIVNINVSETVETVAITVNPNLTTVNINRQVPVGVNGQDLQSVTDIGAITTNPITITVGDGGANGITSYSSQGYGIKGESTNNDGIIGISDLANGVYGSGVTGVVGEGLIGIEGFGTNTGIYGSSSNGNGIIGESEYGNGVMAFSDTATGIYTYSTSGKGIEVYGNGTISVDVNLGSTNKGVVIDSGTSSTGNPIEVNKNGVNKLTVNQQGELTATKLIKQGGTSSQFLMADGSVSTGGGGGGATNLTTSQTSTNFTINSDTGTDASVPLGDGTLAGASLNDYTTAEKNKLGAISGTNTGDQNLQSVTNLGNAIVLPSNKNRGIDITIADLQNQYSNGVRVTLNSQTGTYSNNDAFVAVMNGQNPNTLPNFVGGFYALATGGDNYSFVSEHNTGTVSSSHYIATNATGITSDFAAFNTNNVNVFKVDSLGNTTATKFIKQGGFDYQFLKADGSVDNNIYLTSADLPSTLDLYATTTASDISGYTVLVRNISDTRYNTTAQDVSTGVITSIGQLVGSLVTDANIISGNPGVFDFKTIGNISRTSGTGQAEFFFRIYKRNLAGTETLIAESDYTLPVTNGGYVEFSSTALWNDGVFLDTDRVVLKYYANRLASPVGSDPTYQFQFGGTSPVRSSAAIPTSVMPNIYLRDLADVENVDALNNEVLYWNDSASLWEHSLAEDLVPLATATQKGLVSTTTQTFAGDKTFTGAISASNLSGTNTGDNATNTQYSGLAASKQDTLQSTVNIKSINGNTLLGSGDLVISGTGISSLNGLTGATQTFSVTTSTGTGIPAWSSSGTNHQLNIPIAGGATTTGLITGGSQAISGTKQFQSNPEIPVPAENTTSCIVLGSAGGGGATGTLLIGSTTLYPTALEMQYVKGITSSVQTQLNGKASELDVAEQTYSLSPTFTGTAPTIISSSTYQWNQVGTLVTGRVNLIYTTAGSISQVVIPLPADMPTPLSPTGLSGALDVLYYGVGMFNALTTSVSSLTRSCLLRRNAANTGYEFVITHTAAVSSRVISLTLQYFT